MILPFTSRVIVPPADMDIAAEELSKIPLLRFRFDIVKVDVVPNVAPGRSNVKVLRAPPPIVIAASAPVPSTTTEDEAEPFRLPPLVKGPLILSVFPFRSRMPRVFAKVPRTVRLDPSVTDPEDGRLIVKLFT